MVPGNEGVDITTLSSNSKVYSGPNLITFENTQAMQNYMNNITTVTYYDSQYKYHFSYGLYDYIMNQ